MGTKEQTIDLDELVLRAVNGKDGEAALEALSVAIQDLAMDFDGNPGLALSGELFGRADSLARFGERLGLHFSEQCQSEQAASAWSLRLKVIMIAYPHRRNLAGPALLDYAVCLENLERVDEAQELYTQIITDIAPILSWGPTFNEDWLKAVRSLQNALERCHQPNLELSEQTKLLLAQSEDMVKNQPS